MDKRSLFFIVSLSITLFFVNGFFSYLDRQRHADWYEAQEKKREERVIAFKKSVEEKTLSIEEIPTAIVEVEGESVLAFSQQDHLWVLKSLENQTLSYQEHAYKLESIVDGFGLYTKQKSSNKPKVFALDSMGQYDLQFIDAEGNITLAQYVDGRLKEVLNLPQKDALALVKDSGKLIPAGVYIKDEFTFIPFQRTHKLANLFSFPELLSSEPKEEEFYVLENSHMQLVFSNRGAAIAEINLPFKGQEITGEFVDSVVKPTAEDRKMVEQAPQNAYFPSREHWAFSNGAKTKVQEGKKGGYYPLLRRDLITSQERFHLQAKYYGLNIVSQYPELGELIYRLVSFDQNTIVFEAKQSHRRIRKIYTLTEEASPYCFDLEIQIEGDQRGLWLTSGVPDVELMSGAPAPALKYRMTRGNTVEVQSLKLPKTTTTTTSTRPDWICNSNGFFGLIVDPLTGAKEGYRAEYIEGQSLPSRLVLVDQSIQRHSAESMPGYQMMLPLKEKDGKMQFRIFAGPFSEKILKKADQIYSNPETGYKPDYIACQSFHGWFSFISEPFAKFLFFLMKTFHTLSGSWVLSIVLLTVTLRLMLYPLNAWSMKSMRKMQKIAPKITEVQERYKKDPQKAQMKVLELYKEAGANPLSGCFPMLIQMPFLIGMFDLLKSTFELRGASFVPGWIDNLTAPDVLFTWNMPIFFIGNELHLLPLLLAFVMFLQQRLMSSGPKDVSDMTEQQRQQKAMGTIMTVFFAAMFYRAPSGLNIYWLSSMLLGILQQWWTNRQIDLEDQKPQVIPSAKGKNQKVVS